MIRSFNIILVVLCLVGLAGVYTLKHQTQSIEREKFQLERELARQNTNLSVLRADWAYLSQPAYVAPIVERHEEALQLKVASAEQFGSISDIPMRPEALPNGDELDALFTALDAGIDPIGLKLSELLAGN